MPEMKTLNGYEVVDAKAREDIKSIQEAVEAIPEYDLTPYATKSELPTKVSQLQNDSKFITRDEVPKTDLSEYAKKSELPKVPTKVSAFTNDAGYLTQHIDISGKADKNHTHSQYLTEHQSLAAYAKKSEIPDVSDFITSIPSEYITESELNAKSYATKTYVDNAIDAIEFPEGTDLSEYAKKTEVPTKVSQLTNDKNYLTEIPSEYVTDTELRAKNYLTEHQSLAAYATKTYVDNTIAENQPNLSKYALKTEIPSSDDFGTKKEVQTNSAAIAALDVRVEDLEGAGYATEDYVDEAIANASTGDIDLSTYAKKQDVQTNSAAIAAVSSRVETIEKAGYITSIPSEYVTDTELIAKGYVTQTAANNNYFSKQAGETCQAALAAIQENYVSSDDLNNLDFRVGELEESRATTEYVDTKIAEAQLGGGEGGGVDLSVFATIDLLNESIGTVEASIAAVEESVCGEISGLRDEVQTDYATKTWAEAKIYEILGDIENGSY